MHAIWPEQRGVHALVGVAASGRAVQLALTGKPVLDQLNRYASLLRGLGRRLATSMPLSYARLGIEPTGSGVFNNFSWGPDHEKMEGEVSQRLDRYVPDAYWWQLVDVSLLNGLDPLSVRLR